jgi:hypothetical protein
MFIHSYLFFALESPTLLLSMNQLIVGVGMPENKHLMVNGSFSTTFISLGRAFRNFGFEYFSIGLAFSFPVPVTE